jgi:deoxyribodipyrimidine photo-lyase
MRTAWKPGETNALERLESFAGGAIRDYKEHRDRPDLDGVSRLSPHLHFGEVSPRQCVAAARSAVAESPASQPGAEAFVREIGWREFAHHLIFHYPRTSEEPLDQRFVRFPWRPDPDKLQSWQRGRTGIPIVDAGMRELWSTGWMHNRVRMIVASLLTKNLGLHWREGADWFWDTLVDADLASNTLGWQWTAGCGADAAPFFRIFNPVLQAERYDPLRRYIRRWIPEIAGLPDKLIHQPWTASESTLESAGVTLGSTYPHPIVDLQGSRAAALEAYQSIRAVAGDS